MLVPGSPRKLAQMGPRKSASRAPIDFESLPSRILPARDILSCTEYPAMDVADERKVTYYASSKLYVRADGAVVRHVSNRRYVRKLRKFTDEDCANMDARTRNGEKLKDIAAEYQTSYSRAWGLLDRWRKRGKPGTAGQTQTTTPRTGLAPVSADSGPHRAINPDLETYLDEVYAEMAATDDVTQTAGAASPH